MSCRIREKITSHFWPPIQSRSKNNPLNNLFRHFLSIVEVYMPILVVIENVGDLDNFAQGIVTDRIIVAL